MTSITYKEKRKEKDIDSEGECSVSNNGSNAGDRKKFLDAAIFNCSGSMLPTKTEFPGMKRLSPAQVNKIFEAAENILRKTYSENTRGSRAAADELLAGGIDTTALNKAFRKFGYGNTELAHQLCVRAQLPTSMKGGKVAYIDTEGTFRPNLIVRIAERFGMEPGAVLDNIIYARAYTYEHQYNLLLGLAAKMSEEPFQLLIVDSIVSLFRVDFTGRGELADRQQKLAEMLSMLIKIAEEFNVAVYMTNQVVADPGGGVFISDPKKPAGGRVVDGPFDKVTCAVFYDVGPYYFVEENFMLGNEQLNEAVEEAHVEGDAGAQDEDQLVLNDGDDSDEDFLNENFLFYYKKPLEVKSRFEMLPTLGSFDELFHNAVQLVTEVETPEQVEANRERDGEEALASFTKYYLSTPMTPRDLSGHYPIQLFYKEGFSEAKYLKFEDAVNMEFNSFNPTIILARRPSKLWYSEVWVD